MYCEKCGAKISDDARFCPNCGAEVKAYKEGTKNSNLEASTTQDSQKYTADTLPTLPHVVNAKEIVLEVIVAVIISIILSAIELVFALHAVMIWIHGFTLFVVILYVMAEFAGEHFKSAVGYISFIIISEICTIVVYVLGYGFVGEYITSMDKIMPLVFTCIELMFPRFAAIFLIFEAFKEKAYKDILTDGGDINVAMTLKTEVVKSSNALAILCIVVTITVFSGIVIELLSFDSNRTSESNAVLIDDFNDEKSIDKKLEGLIGSYYKAYAAGDTTALQEIAYPISDAEISYISMLSQYIDSYDVKKISHETGLYDGAYLVSVVYKMSFSRIKTPAPGLDFFYVETDENGKIYINNLYSAYNMSNEENAVDSNITARISEYKQQDDIQALMETAQEDYSKALETDSELKTFVESTLPEKIKEWAEEYVNNN